MIEKSNIRRSFKTGNILWICALLIFISCKKEPFKSSTASTLSKENTGSLCWKDLRYGELPPEGAYAAIDSMVKKWNLCYERIETGCVITDSIENLKKQYKASNQLYFESLEKKLGKD